MVQHIWTHYRTIFVREVLARGRHDYLFVGDTVDPNGSLKGAEPPAPALFLRTRTRTFLKPSIFRQSGLWRLVLRRDLDCVIFVGYYGIVSVWSAALLARLTGKRVLFWTHAYTAPPAGLKGLIRKVFYKLAHGLLCYGHFGKCYAIGAGFAPETLYVMYNCLDLEAQQQAEQGITQDDLVQTRRELFGDADLPMVCCVSRIIPMRRLDLLIEAMALLQQAGHRVNAVLVGDGPDVAGLRQLANERGVSVHFYGPCYDQAKLARIVMASNATVCPGAIGLAAVQSLAWGTPVLSNDDPAEQGPEIETVIPGKTGDTFAPGDVEAIARVMREWTGTTWKRPDVAAQCKAIVDRFYNPAMQRRVIERAVDGLPADDLFWMREPAE